MTSTLTDATGSHGAAERRALWDKRRVLASSLAGTTIEWYDFYIYGTASALVFNHQYFPSGSELASTLASFTTLAVGVLARPIGGIVAGHLGDRIGRKALLVASLLAMGIGSTLIGLVPNFAAIGVLAPILLVVLRLVQGLSAGAEWGGSALLSVEHAPARSRGFFGSFTQVGSAAGMLLATAALSVGQHVFGNAAFQSYGWRIPFLVSAVLVAFGLWIRLGVSDSDEFLEAKQTHSVPKAPLLDVIRRHPRALFVTIGLRLGQNSVYYLVTVYMLSYIVSQRGNSTAGVTAVMIASFIGLFTGPAWGKLSDRFGRKPVSAFGFVAIAVFGWVLFAFLDTGPLALLPLVVILGLNIAHDAVYGPQAAWFAELFPVEVRYSGANMGYQIGTVIGGGIMPIIATLLFAAGGHTPWLICGYLTLMCALSLVATATASETAVRALENRVPERKNS